MYTLGSRYFVFSAPLSHTPSSNTADPTVLMFHVERPTLASPLVSSLHPDWEASDQQCCSPHWVKGSHFLWTSQAEEVLVPVQNSSVRQKNWGRSLNLYCLHRSGKYVIDAATQGSLFSTDFMSDKIIFRSYWLVMLWVFVSFLQESAVATARDRQWPCLRGGERKLTWLLRWGTRTHHTHTT